MQKITLLWFIAISLCCVTMACMKNPQEIHRMKIKESIRNRIKNEELRYGWSMPMSRKKRSQNLKNSNLDDRFPEQEKRPKRSINIIASINNIVDYIKNIFQEIFFKKYSY